MNCRVRSNIIMVVEPAKPMVMAAIYFLDGCCQDDCCQVQCCKMYVYWQPETCLQLFTMKWDFLADSLKSIVAYIYISVPLAEVIKLLLNIDGCPLLFRLFSVPYMHWKTRFSYVDVPLNTKLTNFLYHWQRLSNCYWTLMDVHYYSDYSQCHICIEKQDFPMLTCRLTPN
jgi:hypothetical protein